jgi:hypothetical protein
MHCLTTLRGAEEGLALREKSDTPNQPNISILGLLLSTLKRAANIELFRNFDTCLFNLSSITGLIFDKN